MEKLTFKIEEFEGPLDLLLFLIQKHKLDIRDIQITQLLEQYLAYLDAVQREDLEVASAFLEMASRLVYLKTVMLLPRRQEEGRQLKEELQGQLLEYQVCKLMAAQLERQNQGALVFVRRPQQLEADHSYQLRHPASVLYAAYQDAVGRGRRRLPPPARAFSALVSRRVVSVDSRIIHLLKGLYRTGTASYESLFADSRDRGELVATFLAVLELVKAQRITLEGEQVHLERRPRQAKVPAISGREEETK